MAFPQHNFPKKDSFIKCKRWCLEPRCKLHRLSLLQAIYFTIWIQKPLGSLVAQWWSYRLLWWTSAELSAFPRSPLQFQSWDKSLFGNWKRFTFQCERVNENSIILVHQLMKEFPPKFEFRVIKQLLCYLSNESGLETYFNLLCHALSLAIKSQMSLK